MTPSSLTRRQEDNINDLVADQEILELRIIKVRAYYAHGFDAQQEEIHEKAVKKAPDGAQTYAVVASRPGPIVRNDPDWGEPRMDVTYKVIMYLKKK